MALIAGKHKLTINTNQIHREELLKQSKARKIWTIAKYNIAQTLVHIVYVLFITANNVGFLGASIIAHCVGVVIAYQTQRTDHRHPIHSLALSLKNIEHASEETKNDFVFILQVIRNENIRFQKKTVYK